jgi:Holliday junction resolvase
MTPYEDGKRFEYATRDHLLDDGYWVTRAAGSKTKVDLIGIKSGQVLLVQCKRRGTLSPAERAALLALAALLPGVAVPVLAWKQPRSATVHLDRLTGVGPRDRVPFLTDEVAGY